MALPGKPEALAERASTYVSSASRIERAADDLRALAYASTARSLDAIRERSGQVAGDLSAAYGRYAGTANALVEYAAALREAHRKADDADASEAYAERQAASADTQVSAYDRQLRILEQSTAPAGNIEAAERQLAEARAAARRYDDAASAAREAHEQARRDMEAAAQRAMSLIDSAIDATNESWLDRVGSFFEGLGSFFADLATWVGDFLQDLWDELQRLVSTVLALVGTVLILALVYALLSLIPVIGPLIAALVVGLLAGFLLASILSDVLKPTPQVSEYDRTRREKRGSQGEPTDLAHAIKDAGYVDSLGHHTEDSADETVIKVTKVVDADGVVRWRVALPSTQEWLSRLNGDQGAVNDLDSNLALMLTPSLRSQYERAVRQAMQQAGVGDARRLQPRRDHGGPPRGLQLRLQLGCGRGRRRADRQRAHPVLDDRRLGAARRRPGAATRLGDLPRPRRICAAAAELDHHQQPVSPGVSGSRRHPQRRRLQLDAAEPDRSGAARHAGRPQRVLHRRRRHVRL